MTSPARPLRPDARLVRLHAESGGDPQSRLAGALADLEGAAWGLLLRDEAALARQLAALLGSGTLRVDARVRVDREALAAAGLAAASVDGDWRGARAAWLLEPTEADLERARRSGVDVIVDGTLAPGGGWFAQGAALVVYRDSVTVTGHADAPLSAVFGTGRAPEIAAPAPSDLIVGLALRDVATLPLRLARAARTVAQLADRLGGAAQPAGPTALLLAPDAAPDSDAPLGGVVASSRSVPGGVLLAPGLEEADTALALLRSAEPAQAAPRPAEPPRREEVRREEPRREDFRRDEPRREEPRRDDFRRDSRGGDRSGRDRGGRDRRDFGRGDRPDSGRPAQPDVPERFTFDAPEVTEPASVPPVPAEETWEPEIVYSDIAQPQLKLPIPVSSGPDAPNLGDELPDVLHQPEHVTPADEHDVPVDMAPADETPAQPEGRRDGGRRDRSGRPDRNRAPQRRPEVQAEPTPDTAPLIAPDLPVAAVDGGKDDPAATLSDEQAAVYARLREWRNAEAKRQDISRFIIASNATLAEIARRVPYTEADLKAVKGMGPERLRKYGDKILEVVRG
ncbi:MULTISPECIES: HRDC domain-containing protein [Deinococcus]|uniref:HRDC domain-containing protein n=1 Tax=Deinococcus rufus TaxID=2136097 RepID=A0ABV7Z7W4_9DEIO|nr:HRDC domain-containing protein [Deinococcus sp. AB2017081]WQE96618.1 HRDC domain-containing protein [Deinococcus sp. AB2017081]